MAIDKSNVILITGATGHQGGATARELLAKGARVRAMTRHPEGSQASELKRLRRPEHLGSRGGT